MLGTATVPHFIVQYENCGNVPVTFSEFELLLPRLDGVIDSESGFVLHLGAQLYIDKRPSSRIWGLQHLKALDYRTNKVPLEPGASHTDFFDLGAFVGRDALATGESAVQIPPDFSPVLQFHDSFGHEFHCDEAGVQEGPYVYPHESALTAAGFSPAPSPTLTTARRRIRWFGWTTERTEAARPKSGRPGARRGTGRRFLGQPRPRHLGTP